MTTADDYIPDLFDDCSVPCPEIDALAEELALRGLPFMAEHDALPCGRGTFETWHIIYGRAGGEVSVIWSSISSGHRYGLLEAWDLDERSDPRGFLTAGDVLNLYPPEVAR